MKAAVVLSPGDVEIVDLPMPEVGRYQVLCRHLYGAVCAGTDRHLIKGNLPIPGIEYPLVLGHETIGEVVEVGAGVKNFRIGDRVTRTGHPGTEHVKAFWGGFSEYGLATDALAMRDAGAEEADWSAHMIHRPLPEDVDPAAATMMITWRETHSYLTRLGLTGGERILVLGSGGNGFSFAVLARCLGAATVAMLGNPRWEDVGERAGLDALVDYREQNAADRLRELVPGPFDIIVDSVGITGGLERAIDLLRPGGRIGMYGIEDLGERMAYLKSLAGQGIDARGPGEYSEAEAHDAVVQLLQAGSLDASFWFDPDNPVPLERFPDAIDAIDTRKSLKSIVRLRAD